MSRGFVKEDDQEEAPFIPPRAALPGGVINYVTPYGYEQLLKERDSLEEKSVNINIENDKEKRHVRATLTGSLNLLNERISSARIIKFEDQPKDVVRFGAKVRFRFTTGSKSGEEKTFQLVGVDEANIKEDKIAFVAPLAVALTGKKAGEITRISLGGNIQELEVVEITYP